MKIYTKIVYDKDDNIIEEHSYDYTGPVALTKYINKDGDGPMAAKRLKDRKKNPFERAIIENENITKKKNNNVWNNKLDKIFVPKEKGRE